MIHGCKTQKKSSFRKFHNALNFRVNLLNFSLFHSFFEKLQSGQNREFLAASLTKSISK